MVYNNKPNTLYVFGGAVWPSAPWLAVYSLGLQDKINVDQINLIKGDNFNPDFVAVNREATLPTLILDDRTYNDTTSTVKYLLSIAPADKVGKSTSTTNFVARIHDANVDPNDALLSARNAEELAAKSASIPGLFIRNRYAAIQEFGKSAPSSLADFYTSKTASIGELYDVYEGKTAPEAYFATGQALWASIREFILKEIPAVLPESGYIGGSVPAEEDYHLAAWLARLALLAGATPAADGILKLKAELDGAEVPEKIVSYWKLWSATEAWAVVYKDGLH